MHENDHQVVYNSWIKGISNREVFFKSKSWKQEKAKINLYYSFN